jgi:threonine/homoserine/homoserine lactone efflux protein
MALDLSHPLAAFGLGLALGTSPGPVQLLLLSEASRGGVGRGLRAMAGANLTFGAMLALLAAGLSSVRPDEPFLRVVKVAGGVFLLWLAIDALRARRRPPQARPGDRLHPILRGAIAVVVNPGVYVFLGTTGTAIAADAARHGGRPLALLTVATLLLGVSTMDGGMVILGARARRVGTRALDLLATVLALALAALGIWLAAGGLVG